MEVHCQCCSSIPIGNSLFVMCKGMGLRVKVVSNFCVPYRAHVWCMGPGTSLAFAVSYALVLVSGKKRVDGPPTEPRGVRPLWQVVHAYDPSRPGSSYIFWVDLPRSVSDLIEDAYRFGAPLLVLRCQSGLVEYHMPRGGSETDWYQHEASCDRRRHIRRVLETCFR